MDVPTLQQTLPDKLMNPIVKELNGRNMGQGIINASRNI